MKATTSQLQVLLASWADTDMSSKGFTLLEVLVAMSIFAIIGLGASQMLQTVIKSHERTSEKSESFARLTRGINRMERDFLQVTSRPVRDEYGEPLPPLMAGNSGRYLVEMTRTGWSNPLGRQRSQLQRVAYDLIDGEVRRHFWLVLDRAEDSEAITQPLFDDVEDLRINMISREGEATGSWPEVTMESALPVAAEIIVATGRHGEIRRLVNFPAEAVVTSPEEPPNGADDNTDVDDDAIDIEVTEDTEDREE